MFLENNKFVPITKDPDNYYDSLGFGYNNNNMYVVGSFSKIGGKKAGNVAKWDGKAWTDVGVSVGR